MLSLNLLNFKYEACPFTHLSFTFIFLHCHLLIWCVTDTNYITFFCPFFYHLICGAVENFFAICYVMSVSSLLSFYSYHTHGAHRCAII